MAYGVRNVCSRSFQRNVKRQEQMDIGVSKGI